MSSLEPINPFVLKGSGSSGGSINHLKIGHILHIQLSVYTILTFPTAFGFFVTLVFLKRNLICFHYVNYVMLTCKYTLYISG